jgi:DNA repair ATPase RecN
MKKLKKEIKKRNIEEYFDIIKEYMELDLRIRTLNDKIILRKKQTKMIKTFKTKNLELKKELKNIVNDINKEDEDINKLNKKINNLKDNTQIYLKLILEYIELKEKKEKYILLENLNIQIKELEKQKNDLKAEYKSAKYYYNLENKKVEKIHDLIQTFKDKNEDI